MKQLISILMFLILLESMQSCKDCSDPSNPYCKNYNPCYGKTETSAKFKIEESILDWDLNTIWYETDSITPANNNSVRFSALYDADSFIWKIGSEVYNTKSVILNSFPPDTYITITLITLNKNLNHSCFPNDNGIDTFKKSIYVWPNSFKMINNSNDWYWVITNPYPIDGYYKGYYQSNPNKETIVALFDSVYQIVPHLPQKRYWAVEGVSRNIPDGYKPCLNSNYYYYGATNQRKILFNLFFAGTVFEKKPSGTDSLIEIEGSATLRSDKNTLDIILKYNIGQYPIENWIEDKFTGIKIK